MEWVLSFLIRGSEDIEWRVIPIPNIAPGMYLVETSDSSFGFTGTLTAITRFVESLTKAVKAKEAEGSKDVSINTGV